MNKIVATLALAAASVTGFCRTSSLTVDRVEPPYWWVGMEQDTLQILLKGPGIGAATATVDYVDVSIVDQVRTDNPDYLFLYLKIGKDAAAGTMNLTLSEGKRRAVVPYELRERRTDMPGKKGFDAGDVLYLIMPDRFATDGRNPADGVKGLEYPVMPDRSNLNGRHGGNIGGLMKHLDYIDSLGVTAVWVCPVLENDMPGGSYHGYATTDYYRIDPRFGTNDEWAAFIAEAHKRGIKVVMDMIFNHSGSNHYWMKSMPAADWINNAGEYVQTNHRLSTVFDPYASDYDKRQMVEGWFVRSMPDLNQRNPHLMRYLIQNSIWWIESSDIDGIRMDTYPYADREAMADWLRAVRAEYPDFNIVGECWYGNEGSEAFWQRGSYVNPGADTELETVMDFIFAIKGRDMFGKETRDRQGLHEVYDHLALDYLFPRPDRILTFLDNHDTDRFLTELPEELGWWKQAMALLLTTRGIPQLYYGTEILMHGTRSFGDGSIRLDMPGFEDSDSINVFAGRGLTDQQQEALAFMRKLLNWRKGNEVIARGKLKHFVPDQGVYVYERRLGDRQVVVMMNGREEPVVMDMEQTHEIMPYGSRYTDMLSGKSVEITPQLVLPARALYILEN